MKIAKRYPEVVRWRRKDNAMIKRKRPNNDITQKTKERTTCTLHNTKFELWCPAMVSSFSSICDTCRVTIDSVAASLPVVTLYQVDHNRNHKFKNMRSAKRYKLHIHVLLECWHIHTYINRKLTIETLKLFIVSVWMCRSRYEADFALSLVSINPTQWIRCRRKYHKTYLLIGIIYIAKP